MSRVLVSFALIFCSAAGTVAQTTKPPAANPAQEVAVEPDRYAREPYVIEELQTRLRFEEDGTGRREISARIRVQDAAGLQQLGQLVWEYNAANETLDVEYVRVRKADGSVVTAGPDAVQDLSSPVAREAPVYTDSRQKHVTVPALRPGETLEFQYLIKVRTPYAPGQFWAEHQFTKQGIVLNERLEIDVPGSRPVKQKSKQEFEPKITEQGNRRVYLWTSHHLKSEQDEKDAAKKSPKKNADFADVQLTTFAGWDQVGKWYAELERDRRVVTPELQAKANALVTGLASDLEKVQAIYEFVGRNVRYVSLSFGVGRYQPHSASEIYANQYGDCKDKSTLLSAMLKAAGYEANAVLINAAREIDPDVPSPAQFNHVITQVTVGGQVFWLDTTPEVAPFRHLMMPLRKKRALVVAQAGPSSLKLTPAEAPLGNWNRMEGEGKVSELGRLTLKLKLELRGDTELIMRMVLRKLPESKWQDMLGMFSSMAGLSGKVSDIKVVSLDSSRDPLKITFTVTEANYLDWNKKKSMLRIPMGNTTLPAPDDVAEEPLKLGTTMEEVDRIRLEFPAGFKLRAPLPMSVKREYVEYSSDYRVEGAVLTATRKLAVLKDEVPAASISEYAALRRAVNADEEQRLGVEGEPTAAPSIAENDNVEEMYDSAYAALRAGKPTPAIELFERVVSLEPKHKYAWNNLGRCYLNTNKLDQAENAFRRAIEVNPFEEWAYNNLGLTLWRKQKLDEAAASFAKQIEVNPLDPYAHKNLGQLFIEMKRYAEAVPELEKASSIAPDDPRVQTDLGRAYLNDGHEDKAIETFEAALQNWPGPLLMNNIAYELAERNVQLGRARQYAEKAVDSVVAALRNLPAAKAKMGHVLTIQLASYWDTLGWVLFREGDLTGAEKYLLASWSAQQSGVVADHLGQVYEKKGDTKNAIRYYEYALATIPAHKEARPRLLNLNGKASPESAAIRAASELSLMRTVKLASGPAEDNTAEFDVVLSNLSGVEEAVYVSGSDKLKDMKGTLSKLKIEFPFPDDRPTRIARRGIVSCSKLLAACTLVFIDARFAEDILSESELSAVDGSQAIVTVEK